MTTPEPVDPEAGPELLDDPEAELTVTLPPPYAQPPPDGMPHGRMCQDDPSWDPEGAG